MNSKPILASSFLIAGLGTPLALSFASMPAPRMIPWDVISMTFEINSTDADSGMLFHIDTSERIERCQVENAAGQVVFESSVADPQGLGVTCMVWESAEPDIPSAPLAWPEGTYTIIGTAFNGTIVEGDAEVSHEFPARPRVLTPIPGAVLPLNNVVVTWLGHTSAEAYWLEIDDEHLENSYTIYLTPGVTSFQMPLELLQPDSEYKFSVGAIHENGNVTTTSVEFETLP